IPMSGTAGKVALVQGTAALSGTGAAIAEEPAVVDLVGFGAANGFAGAAPAPGTTNATSISRDATHTNRADNSQDFAVGTPSPEAWTSTDPDPDPDPDPTSVTIAEV